ncbi:MAG: hypothetical protein GY815_15525 [Gammaproteobacteria bacterium]|nr:hypothetical protein [Gammaproteobacteria bacterium]
MAEHRLDPLLRPASIALLGVSERSGRPALNRKALIDAIVTLSLLALEFSEIIAEIDINPMLVDERRAIAVDALVLRKTPDAPC